MFPVAFRVAVPTKGTSLFTPSPSNQGWNDPPRVQWTIRSGEPLEIYLDRHPIPAFSFDTMFLRFSVVLLHWMGEKIRRRLVANNGVETDRVTWLRRSIRRRKQISRVIKWNQLEGFRRLMPGLVSEVNGWSGITIYGIGDKYLSISAYEHPDRFPSSYNFGSSWCAILRLTPTIYWTTHALWMPSCKILSRGTCSDFTDTYAFVVILYSPSVRTISPLRFREIPGSQLSANARQPHQAPSLSV